MNKLTADTIFQPVSLNKNLAKKTVRGGMSTMGAQFIKFVLQIASTMTLARLLTPEDYGLLGMVAVVVGFAQMFKDAGLSMATIQRKTISHEQISTLFWINIIISFTIGVGILIASPLVSIFYGKPELTAITATLSFSFIISGLSIQHTALLRRHMRFSSLAMIQIISQIATLIITVFLAFQGLRYWALVGGTLATALCTVFLTFFFCPWIPGRMSKGTGVRNMLKFGGNLTGFNFVNYFSRNADNILIGKFIGTDALGIYTKAYQLLLLPVGQIRVPINNVALPALCSLCDDQKRYKRYYYSIIFTLSFLAMPLVGFLFVFADSIILLVLGNQWYEAVGIFQVLAATALLQSAAQAGRGLPLLSMGHSRRYFHFGIVQACITCLGMTIGLHWGAIGVAAGYGASFTLLIPVTIPWCLKDSPVTLWDWFSSILAPLIATISMVSILLGIRYSTLKDINVFDFAIYEHIQFLVGGGVVASITYLCCLLLLPNGRRNFFITVEKFRNNIRS